MIAGLSVSTNRRLSTRLAFQRWHQAPAGKRCRLRPSVRIGDEGRFGDDIADLVADRLERTRQYEEFGG